MFWKEDFLAKRRAEWLRQISKIQFSVNGTWIDAAISDKKVEGNSMIITTVASNDVVGKRISAVRLLDLNGDIAGELTESILSNPMEGMMILWEFPLYEI